MQQRRWAIILWTAMVLLTIGRMILGAVTELSPDEAYYYLWAERLDWSYYSKGPGIALALKLSTSIFGVTELGIRFLSPLLGLGTSILLYRLGSRLFDQRSAMWTVAMLNLTPIFNAGSLVMTIDPLMLFFWVAAMWAFWNALQKEGRAMNWWIIAGISLGCGFLAKYTILLLLISMLLYVLASPQHRRELIRPGFWSMLGTLSLFLTPVLVWNSRNEWITVRHLLERGSIISRETTADAAKAIETGWFNPSELLGYLGLHLGVYSPLIFIGLLITMGMVIRRLRRGPSETFVGIFSLPVILMYFILSLKTTGEVNWTAPGFLALGLMVPTCLDELKWNQRFKHTLVTVGISLAAISTVLALNPDILRSSGLSWDYENDPFMRLRGWETAAREIEEQITELTEETGEAPFVVANKYQIAAILAFYMSPEIEILRPTRDHPAVHMVQGEIAGVPQNQFSFWPDYYTWTTDESGERSQPFLRANAIYVTVDTDRENARPVIRQAFREVRKSTLFQVDRHGDPLRGWLVFTCYDYQMLHQ